MAIPLEPPDSEPRSALSRLVRLALPIVGLNTLSVLALTVDTAMCGRLPDAKDALTALGFSTQIVYIMIIVVTGLSIGAASLTARAHGAGQPERAERVLGQGIVLVVIVSVGVALVGNLFGPVLLAALGAEGPLIELAMQYLAPMMTFVFFQYLSLFFAAVLRGIGNTRLPFFIAIVVNVANFGLNYGLILGNYGLPSLGVRGAAYGTVIAYAIGVTIYLAVFLRGSLGIRLRLSTLRPDGKLVGTIARVGTPAALDVATLNVALASLVSMVGRIEQVAVGAHGLGIRVQGLAYVPGFAVSQATAAMVGQALGARDIAGARSATKVGVGVCTALMAVLAFSIYFAAEPIVSAFDVAAGSRLEVLSVEWIRQLGLCMPLVGVYVSFIGALQGAGATMTGLYINVAVTLAFQLPLSWLLGFPLGFGVVGVWWAFPLSFVPKAVASWLAYRRGKWARVGL
ncbi:MAG: MATE family efflux transporter [Myxococcales bacterium]|nr:MATE family efflux transporter [Myxococcales bacterium]